MTPTARTDGLTTRKLGDELVVFDKTSGAVHYLNRVAEAVWRSCDGRTDLPALARIVGRSTGVPDAGPAVELALEQLSRRGLLVTPVERPPADRRRDRRQALKGLAAALAIPTVLTVTATRARAESFCSIVCPDGKTMIPGHIYGGQCMPFGICPGAGAAVSPPVANCSGVPNGQACAGGVCCGGECRSPEGFLGDPFNCGTCGHVCPVSQTCVNGQCVGQA